MIPKEDREGPVVVIRGLGVESSGNSYAEVVSNFLFEKNLSLNELANMVGFNKIVDPQDLQDFILYLSKDSRFEVSIDHL